MASLEMHGYLWKQGGKRKTWHRRFFFVLWEESSLCYARDESGKSNPLGRVSFREMSGVTLDLSEKGQPKKCRGLGLELFVPGRTYRIAAESEKDRNDWFQFLRTTRIRYHRRTFAEVGIPKRRLSDDDSSGSTSPTLSSPRDPQRRMTMAVSVNHSRSGDGEKKEKSEEAPKKEPDPLSPNPTTEFVPGKSVNSEESETKRLRRQTEFVGSRIPVAKKDTLGCSEKPSVMSILKMYGDEPSDVYYSAEVERMAVMGLKTKVVIVVTETAIYLLDVALSNVKRRVEMEAVAIVLMDKNNQGLGFVIKGDDDFIIYATDRASILKAVRAISRARQKESRSGDSVVQSALGAESLIIRSVLDVKKEVSLKKKEFSADKVGGNDEVVELEGGEGDLLKWSTHRKMAKLLASYGDERVVLSDYVEKINNYDRKQKRAVGVTENAVYTMHPDKRDAFRRAIKLDSITAVGADENDPRLFAIFVPTENDLLLISESRLVIIAAIRDAFQKKMGKELEFVISPNIKKEVSLKKSKDTEERRKMGLLSSITNVKKELERVVESEDIDAIRVALPRAKYFDGLEKDPTVIAATRILEKNERKGKAIEGITQFLKKDDELDGLGIDYSTELEPMIEEAKKIGVTESDINDFSKKIALVKHRCEVRDEILVATNLEALQLMLDNTMQQKKERETTVDESNKEDDKHQKALFELALRRFDYLSQVLATVNLMKNGIEEQSLWQLRMSIDNYEILVANSVESDAKNRCVYGDKLVSVSNTELYENAKKEAALLEKAHAAQRNLANSLMSDIDDEIQNALRRAQRYPSLANVVQEVGVYLNGIDEAESDVKALETYYNGLDVSSMQMEMEGKLIEDTVNSSRKMLNDVFGAEMRNESSGKGKILSLRVESVLGRKIAYKKGVVVNLWELVEEFERKFGEYRILRDKRLISRLKQLLKEWVESTQEVRESDNVLKEAEKLIEDVRSSDSWTQGNEYLDVAESELREFYDIHLFEKKLFSVKDSLIENQDLNEMRDLIQSYNESVHRNALLSSDALSLVKNIEYLVQFGLHDNEYEKKIRDLINDEETSAQSLKDVISEVAVYINNQSNDVSKRKSFASLLFTCSEADSLLAKKQSERRDKPVWKKDVSIDDVGMNSSQDEMDGKAEEDESMTNTLESVPEQLTNSSSSVKELTEEESEVDDVVERVEESSEELEEPSVIPEEQPSRVVYSCGEKWRIESPSQLRRIFVLLRERQEAKSRLSGWTFVFDGRDGYDKTRTDVEILFDGQKFIPLGKKSVLEHLRGLMSGLYNAMKEGDVVGSDGFEDSIDQMSFSMRSAKDIIEFPFNSETVLAFFVTSQNCYRWVLVCAPKCSPVVIEKPRNGEQGDESTYVSNEPTAVDVISSSAFGAGEPQPTVLVGREIRHLLRVLEQWMRAWIAQPGDNGLALRFSLVLLAVMEHEFQFVRFLQSRTVYNFILKRSKQSSYLNSIVEEFEKFNIVDSGSLETMHNLCGTDVFSVSFFLHCMNLGCLLDVVNVLLQDVDVLEKYYNRESSFLLTPFARERALNILKATAGHFLPLSLENDSQFAMLLKPLWSTAEAQRLQEEHESRTEKGVESGNQEERDEKNESDERDESESVEQDIERPQEEEVRNEQVDDKEEEADVVEIDFDAEKKPADIEVEVESDKRTTKVEPSPQGSPRVSLPIFGICDRIRKYFEKNRVEEQTGENGSVRDFGDDSLHPEIGRLVRVDLCDEFARLLLVGFKSKRMLRRDYTLFDLFVTIGSRAAGAIGNDTMERSCDVVKTLIEGRVRGGPSQWLPVILDAMKYRALVCYGLNYGCLHTFFAMMFRDVATMSKFYETETPNVLFNPRFQRDVISALKALCIYSFRLRLDAEVA